MTYLRYKSCTRHAFYREFVKIITAIAVMACMPSAHAQTTKLYLAHTGGAGSLYEACANEFTRRVNAHLPQSYRVVPVGASGLGEDTAVLEKLKSGTVAISLPSTIMSGMSNRFGVFELPFLIRDRAQLQRVSRTLLDDYLQPAAHGAGYRILALWENGFRHITNNVRPIRKPEDLHGLKIRIPKGPWREKIFRALGAEPVPMALHEVYAALSNHIVDGQENPLSQIKGSKFTEVQRYLTYSAHIYTPGFPVGRRGRVRQIAAERAGRAVIDGQGHARLGLCDGDPP